MAPKHHYCTLTWKEDSHSATSSALFHRRPPEGRGQGAKGAPASHSQPKPPHRRPTIRALPAPLSPGEAPRPEIEILGGRSCPTRSPAWETSDELVDLLSASPKHLLAPLIFCPRQIQANFSGALWSTVGIEVRVGAGIRVSVRVWLTFVVGFWPGFFRFGVLDTLVGNQTKFVSLAATDRRWRRGRPEVDSLWEFQPGMLVSVPSGLPG